MNLEWEKMNKTSGDHLLISCIGESAGKNNNTGAWLSASEVMETIFVPGDEGGGESSGNDGDEDDTDKEEGKKQEEHP